MDAVRGLDEVAWNAYFLSESAKAVGDDPVRIIRLAWTKLLRLWNPFPNVESYQSSFVRLVSALWAIPTFALAIVGMLLLPKIEGAAGGRTVLFLVLPALYVSALHALFVGSVRYRLTVMPMLEILAAFALVAVLSRGRRRGSDGDRGIDG
jgi:hypothetical protein